MGLGSGIQKKPIPDPGVKKAPDPGSGFATLICTTWHYIVAHEYMKQLPLKMRKQENTVRIHL